MTAPIDSTPVESKVSGDTERSEQKARAAGRGGVAVLGAKVFFILAGFVQQALLARAIGLAEYGALSRVLSKANVLNNVVVSGSTQGVSRAVARAPEHEEEAFRGALRVHAPLAVVLAVAFVLLAPVFAWFEHAPNIVMPLMTLGGVVLLYGLYAPLIGFLNGRAKFTRQAALDVTFATLRTAFMVGIGYVYVKRGMSGALGATIGFVLAAACILPLALRWTGVGRAGTQSRMRPMQYLAELIPLSGAQLFTNLLMQADITLLGRFLSLGAAASGMRDNPQHDADEWVGVYRACQLFAFLPYQLLFSITQVLFPMLARARAEGDEDAVRRYIARGARLGAIACGLLVSVVAALPGPLLAFAYPTEIAERGATTLRVLALGQGAFAMLGIALTIMTSLGREWRAVMITAGAVAAVVVACWIFVPDTSFGEMQLLRTSIATGSALVVALLVAATTVRRWTGAFVPLATAARVVLAVALCTAAGAYLPHFGKLVTPVLAVAVAAGYVVLLLVTRELGRDDLASVKMMIGKRRAG